MIITILFTFPTIAGIAFIKTVEGYDAVEPGTYNPASSTPEEFRNYSDAIRRSEAMLGSSIKRCQPEEVEMSKVSRKSLHLSRDKNEGDVLKEDDFLLMRPGTGINYDKKEFLVGRILKRNLKKGHLIEFSDFS